MNRPEYSVVIPNWNGANLLRKNIPEVVKACPGAEILIVDDASTDDSVEVIKELRKKYRNIRLVEKNANSGFSTTVNLGVRESSGEIVILLNSDVRPKPGFAEKLFPYFADSRTFAVGIKDVSFEGGKQVERGRSIGKFTHGFLMHRLGKIKKGFSLWANGGSSAVSRKIWLELGGLDTIYDPFYGEDFDLGYRAWKSGYQIYFEPDSVVDHYHEEGIIRKKFGTGYRKAVTFRNQNIFILKNISDFSLICQYFIFIPYHLVKSLLRKDYSFFYGFFLFIGKIPQSLIVRGRVQEKFIKSDNEIMSIFSDEFDPKNEQFA